MKSFRFAALITLFLANVNMTFAYCGTIEMWHSRYFEAKTEEQKHDALMFIHCQPVVDSFEETESQNKLLAELLLTALKAAEEDNSGSNEARYTRDLVIKNLVRFKAWKIKDNNMRMLLRMLAEKKQITVGEYKELLNRIPARSAIYTDQGMGSSHQAYTKQVRKEVYDIGL